MRDGVRYVIRYRTGLDDEAGTLPEALARVKRRYGPEITYRPRRASDGRGYIRECFDSRRSDPCAIISPGGDEHV